ncbi:MAG: Gfo/Idh/MocA family oxidoreductase [Pseudomonadota bacterium]
MTIKVLGVGAGYFSQFHYEAWHEHPDVELVGIVDPDEHAASAMAARFHIPECFKSFDAALNSVQPHLVDIITPPTAHLALIDTAMAEGIPTICQKPLCGNIEDARKAVRFSSQSDVPLIVHENFRFQPWYRLMAGELANGTLGEVYQLTFRLRPGDGQGPDAYLSRQPYFQSMPRFLMHETGVHYLDVFRYLLGEPAWVWADLRRLNPAIKGEDAGIIILGYADGRRAILDGNRLADHRAMDPRRTMGEALLEGSAATLELNGYGQLELRRHGETDVTPLPVEAHPTRFGGGCVATLQNHVVDYLQTGAALENTARDYLRTMALVEAAYRSAETGARVDVSG